MGPRAAKVNPSDSWVRADASLREAPTGLVHGKAHPNFTDSNGEKQMGINKDQVEGRVKEAAGKVQESAGKATGNVGTQAKGLGKQATGAAQAKYGDAKETVKDHHRDAVKNP
jgi:uncharacterized protein YjbJ (UPF0337 family)